MSTAAAAWTLRQPESPDALRHRDLTTIPENADRSVLRFAFGPEPETELGAQRRLSWLGPEPPRLFHSILASEDRGADQSGDAAPSQAILANASLSLAEGPDRERAIECLTAAVYYEASNEPLEGRQAVAQVVLNRVRHPAYPKSVCGVVFQGSGRRTGCQFTFTCDGSLHRRPSVLGWRRAEEVAEQALNGYVSGGVVSALNYHADYVSPYWAPRLMKLTQIGAHIFYAPGRSGPVGGTPYAGGESSAWSQRLGARATIPVAIGAMATAGPAMGKVRPRQPGAPLQLVRLDDLPALAADETGVIVLSRAGR